MVGFLSLSLIPWVWADLFLEEKTGVASHTDSFPPPPHGILLFALDFLRS